MHDEYFQFSPLRQKLQRAAHRKKLTALVDGMPNLEIVEFLQGDEDIISVSGVWREFVRYDAPSFARIRFSEAHEELHSWLLGCLGSLGLETSYFLSIGGMSDLPWLRVQADSGGCWLPELCATGQAPDLMILSADGNHALGFIETEYELLALLESADELERRRASRAE